MHTPIAGAGGNGAKAYHCSNCGGMVSSSDRLLAIGDHQHHRFVNPAGIEYRFYTFASCPGAMATGTPTQEYSWFDGYGWRLAFCRTCGLHLGWRYAAVDRQIRPAEFWGILIPQLLTR